MANHFSDIGFEFDEYDYAFELEEIVDSGSTGVDTVVFGDTAFLKVSFDNRIRLWLKKNGNGFIPESVTPYFITDTALSLTAAEQIDSDPFGMTGLVRGWKGSLPINITVPVCSMIKNHAAEDTVIFNVCAFAESVEVYDSPETFNESCSYGDDFGAETFISTGCYDSFGNEKVSQSSRAMISGTVIECEKMINEYTGYEFYRIRIKTAGMELEELVSAEEVLDKIIPGNVVFGHFWLMGVPVSFDSI